jgi:membrane protein implicated in regulation of membrane protease activity
MTAFTIFLAIAGFGFLFLLVSLVFGEIFDHLGADLDHGFDGDHGGPGFFSTRILSVFVTCFGGFGAVAAWFGQGLIASIVSGLVGGFLFAGTLLVFARFLYQQQASTELKGSDLVGVTARVVVAIPAGGLGQVRCQVGEQVLDKIARAAGEDAIAENRLVKIEEVLGEAVVVRPVA